MYQWHHVNDPEPVIPGNNAGDGHGKEATFSVGSAPFYEQPYSSSA
jgi:hypothetical protein